MSLLVDANKRSPNIKNPKAGKIGLLIEPKSTKNSSINSGISFNNVLNHQKLFSNKSHSFLKNNHKQGSTSTLNSLNSSNNER